jgi:hypothetical protein
MPFEFGLALARPGTMQQKWKFSYYHFCILHAGLDISQGTKANGHGALSGLSLQDFTSHLPFAKAMTSWSGLENGCPTIFLRQALSMSSASVWCMVRCDRTRIDDLMAFRSLVSPFLKTQEFLYSPCHLLQNDVWTRIDDLQFRNLIHFFKSKFLELGQGQGSNWKCIQIMRFLSVINWKSDQNWIILMLVNGT